MEYTKGFKNIKPDILHVHTPIASVLARIAGKLAKVPSIIYTAHGFYFHDNMPAKKYKLFFTIEKLIGKYFTDYIFTQSQEDYTLAIENKFRPENKIVWISNGIDLDNKFNYETMASNENLKNSLGFSEEDFIITFVGRLVKEKGILDLLEAADGLPHNIKLVIIGELPDKERDNSIIEKINYYRDTENILFTGQIENINEFLFISDAFCLPSYREGMPRSIIEAMAMRNAIIATNIRGSREEVIDGETGYLIDVERPDLIKDKILELYYNRTLLTEMQQKSYERAHALYDENDVISTQLAVFESVI